MERPEPGAIAVDLEIRPIVSHGQAVQAEPGGRHLGGVHRLTIEVAVQGRRNERSDLGYGRRRPGVEVLGGAELARTVQGVSDERAVAEPAVLVLGEVRGGHDAPPASWLRWMAATDAATPASRPLPRELLASFMCYIK